MNPKLIILLVVLVFLIGCAALIYFGDKRRRNGATQDQGSNPGQGHHLLHSNYGSGRSTSSSTTRIPKNPADYAKSFAPKKTDK